MRTRTYSDFQTAVIAKIGDTQVSSTLGSWINSAFNERLRYAMTAAQWPDIAIWEQRWADNNGLLAYELGYDPYTLAPTRGIEYLWGVYTNSPYENAGTRQAKYKLNDAGAVIIAPATATTSGIGVYQYSGLPGPYWILYVPTWPLYSGSNYSASTAYSKNTVVWDGTTGDYYQSIFSSVNVVPTNTDYWTLALSTTDTSSATAYSGAAAYVPGDIVSYNTKYYVCYVANGQGVGNAVSNTTCWRRLTISSALYNYLVHSVYADYLLSVKNNDKHKAETAYADRLLADEKQRLVGGESQIPTFRVLTHVSTQFR